MNAFIRAFPRVPRQQIEQAEIHVTLQVALMSGSRAYVGLRKEPVHRW